MVLISYDISDDKKRNKFVKFIKKFGHRIQYSVFEIENSNRVLDNIINEIKNRFEPIFDESDSIYIFKMSSSCETVKFGYPIHEDDELLII